VCGVCGRVSKISPLTGENEDRHHEHPRKRGRRKGTGDDRRAHGAWISLPVGVQAVKRNSSNANGAAIDVLVVVVVDQPAVAEAAHRLDDRQQRVALVGEAVLDARR
jgi:hypothetical protein